MPVSAVLPADQAHSCSKGAIERIDLFCFARRPSTPESIWAPFSRMWVCRPSILPNPDEVTPPLSMVFRTRAIHASESTRSSAPDCPSEHLMRLTSESLRGQRVQTAYDWVTIAIFAGLLVLFLQRSTAEVQVDRAIDYLPPAICCALANYLGNNGHDLVAVIVLLTIPVYVWIVLKPHLR